MTKKEIELKPCPFCGGKAELKRDSILAGPRAYVKCKECGVETQRVDISLDYAAYEVAKQIWNCRKKSEPEQKRVVDIMDEVMENICDEYCKFPDYLSEEGLNAKCDECPFERLG